MRPAYSGIKAAFTLAEVLITLVVIGVVAAMTLPNLIQNYKETVLKNQFKKMYSVLSQAFQYTTDTLGTQAFDCYNVMTNGVRTYTSSGCTAFWAEFPQHLQTIKFCDGNAFADGCMPKYNETVTGCDIGSMSTASKAYILKDGSMLFFRPNNYIVMFDTNGFKGPNKLGLDFFVLEMGFYTNSNSGNLGTYWQTQSNMDIAACLPDNKTQGVWKYLKQIYD